MTMVGRASVNAGRGGISAIVTAESSEPTPAPPSSNAAGLAKNFSIVSRITGLNSFSDIPIRSSSL